MTDARVTQAPTLVAYEGDTDARVTQIPALVTYTIIPDARVTQIPLLGLYEISTPCRLTQMPLLALFSGGVCLAQRAQIWRIVRLDGTAFRYTSHDEPVTFRGEVYTPCYSLRQTATSGGITSGSDAGDAEITGLISDSAITEEDLANGLFDGASVEVWLLPWDTSTTIVPRRLTKGVVARLEHNPTSYTATVQTPGVKLTQSPLLQAYTPACRWDLGSPECGVNLDSTYLEIGSVTNIFPREAINAITFRKFVDTSRTESDGFFDNGTLTWTSGSNTGVTAEIKSYESGTFELWDVLPNEIELGDAYEVLPGCAKTTADCSGKFSNLINFGGFPNIPGRDSIYETPDAK